MQKSLLEFVKVEENKDKEMQWEKKREINIVKACAKAVKEGLMTKYKAMNIAGSLIKKHNLRVDWNNGVIKRK